MNQKLKNQKGITLIALVITIIVLLILVAVSIATLTGENGILTKASDAKREYAAGEEEEALTIAYNGATVNKLGDVVVAEDINEQFEKNETNAIATDGENYTIIVEFLESGKIYEIYENGVIDEVIKVLDNTPGVLDGVGSESEPYIIKSIEDLVAFAQQVNNGNTFEEKCVMLGNDLNFKSNMSYVNASKVYSEFGDINENGMEESIMIENITAHGFMPIGNSEENIFKGYFDGNGCEIKNLYIYNGQDETMKLYNGLFGNVELATIIDLKLTGTINVSGGTSGVTYVGGIIACAEDTIISNSINRVNVEVNTSEPGMCVGGIAGNTQNAKMEKCCNYGNIKVYAASGYIGGLTGAYKLYEKGYNLNNCVNYGDVYGEGNTASVINVGGITGYARMSDEFGIYACYNIGDITAINSKGKHYAVMVGGIAGRSRSAYDNKKTSVINISNCYNAGKIYGKAGGFPRDGGITGENGSGYCGLWIDRCYYLNSTCNQITDIDYGTIENTESVTSDKLKSRDMIDILNENLENPCWKFNNTTENNGYPILDWQ